MVLGTTAGGAVFGGYNPRGWIGKQNYDIPMMTHMFTRPTPLAYITTYCHRVPDVSGVLEKCIEVSIKTECAQSFEAPEVTYSMHDVYMAVMRHFREASQDLPDQGLSLPG